METNEIADQSVESTNYKNKSSGKIIGSATILGISGVSAVIAGVITSNIAKKKSQELLKDLGKEQIPPAVFGSPYALAFKALAWGTVWAVGGCSLILFGVWKWYGFKDLNDLRTRARSRIKSTTNSNERTEFSSLSDFLNYLNETTKLQSKASDSKTS